ncbi:hypothetical protein Esti_003353 [Eimeria stiedai]
MDELHADAETLRARACCCMQLKHLATSSSSSGGSSSSRGKRSNEWSETDATREEDMRVQWAEGKGVEATASPSLRTSRRRLNFPLDSVRLAPQEAALPGLITRKLLAVDKARSKRQQLAATSALATSPLQEG